MRKRSSLIDSCTGSMTFFSSVRPGDGVRSGNTRPSMTKVPSWYGSPKSPPYAIRHRVQVAAAARFVAERPHDHRRVVLVPFDGTADPVHAGVCPDRVVGGVALPVREAEAVRLEVALDDHPHPELVAEAEEL